MRLSRIAAISALSLALGSIAVAQAATTAGEDAGAAATGQEWPQEPRWSGPGPMPRHYLVTMWGIPQPYAGMTNPLPDSGKVRKRGARIYAEHCASCHGARGAGDGEEGASLSPSPGNLVWLSDVPKRQWDAFMYWSTAEGGEMLGTQMPAYKDTLSSDEIWAVTAYIQANLPFVSQF